MCARRRGLTVEVVSDAGSVGESMYMWRRSDEVISDSESVGEIMYMSRPSDI